MLQTLRELRESDSAAYFRWINDPELVRLNANYAPTSFSQHQGWFSSIGNRSDLKIFTIQDESEQPVGSCSLRNIDYIHRSAELQIRIGEDSARGKGLGSRAVRDLLDFGFKDLHLNRIFLHVFASNARARRVYEKTGFTTEGVLREAYFIAGEWEDSILMAMLRKDYQKKQATP
ncbi:N-acetyltransferase [Algimonas ampicilliniresistens]|uniref:N-acetyltransferase n=1 Tax=Algimonas ampicilliniresistens TaxID=1298735 RepID=A0ABQ5VB45_9PROT|nr:GNAT family protein [Algimonas ampicilliniresistens]GLQ24724.1 N-acetyltransferase [Algimonas ampicilliniresistens]